MGHQQLMLIQCSSTSWHSSSLRQIPVRAGNGVPMSRGQNGIYSIEEKGSSQRCMETQCF